MNAKELTLRVVPLDKVVLHEQVEKKRVESLASRLKTDRILKNPPIVAPLGDQYVVLDGATRVTALRQINCCDIVVQIVDYHSENIVLETWNHMLLDLPVNEFMRSLQQMPGLAVEPSSADSAEATLARRESIASVMLADGRVFSLRAQNGLADQARLLNQLVAAYEDRGEMYRVAHTDVERLLSEHQRLQALIVFPRYRPEEIRHLAINGAKLPMGITRHIIPGRALRINIPLDILEADEPIEKKNTWLDEWMKVKMRERHIRFYQEPVFLFDE